MHAEPENAPYPRRDVIRQPRPTAIKRCRAQLRAFLQAKLPPKNP